MNEFSTYEFVVKQRVEGKWLLYRVGLIFLYASLVIGLLLAAFLTRIFVPLLALTPVLLWILIFCTWRYADVEYEYSISSGELVFSKVFGGRSRKRLLTIRLRDAVRIAPLDGAEHSRNATAWRPEREYAAISSLKAPDIYFILFEYEDAKRKEKHRAIFYFEATARALQICRFYNPSATVLTKTTR